MTKEEILNAEEETTVTLDLDDGSTVECQVITIVSANGKDFIALLPIDGPEKDTGNVYLYEFREVPGADPDLIDIASDEDFEAASDAFDEFLDNAEFDELVEESEEADEK
ncbi:MAG: DUF1292 domain-containing protein [Lachnospiraceae bacterium]|nr:DUF1292 domain-containing protein [Lachnospiraceae bacterium]